MSKSTKSRRVYKPAAPVAGVARWLQRPMPGNGFGLLMLATSTGDDVYQLTTNVDGFRLEKRDGTAYQLPTDCSACTCKDHGYRRRPCKHMRGLKAALASLPVYPLPPRKPQQTPAPLPTPVRTAAELLYDPEEPWTDLPLEWVNRKPVKPAVTVPSIGELMLLDDARQPAGRVSCWAGD